MPNQGEKVPRFRPTEAQRFPADPLPRALEQAQALYRIAQTVAVPVPAATKVWGFTEKSSGGPQTVSCLKAYGLLEDSGSGSARRIRLSDIAIKIIRDPREISSERDSLVREAALRPGLFRQIVNHFRGLPPSDEALKTYLVFDVGMRDGAVNDCMRVFAATMAFAKVGSTDMIPEGVSVNSRNGEQIEIGTTVQWAPGGVWQFEAPRPVTGLSLDRRFAFVEGSSTGLPIEEIEIVQPAQDASQRPPAAPATVPPQPASPFPAPAGNTVVSPAKAGSPPLAPTRPGIERASFPLKGGLAVVEMPATLSQEDFEDFEAWMQLVLRKAKRSVQGD